MRVLRLTAALTLWMGAYSAVGAPPPTKPELVFLVGGSAPQIRHSCFTSDGKLLASDADGSTVVLWNLATGTTVANLGRHQQDVLAIACSADGKYVATGSSEDNLNGEIKLWDVTAQKEANKIAQGTRKLGLGIRAAVIGRVDALAFSPDGKVLAAGSNGLLGDLKLFDVQSGKELPGWSRKHFQVTALAYSPYGSYGLTLAVGLRSGLILLWNPDRAKPVATLEGLESGAVQIVVNHGGDRLAATDGKHVVVWNTGSGLQRFHGEGAGVSFSDDGTAVAVLGVGEITAPHVQHYAPALVAVPAFSRGNSWFLDAGRGQASLINAESGRPGSALVGERLPDKRHRSSVAFSLDGIFSVRKGLLAIGGGGRIHIFDLATGEQTRTLYGPSDSLAFAPDGTVLASQAPISDAGIYLWNLEDGTHDTLPNRSDVGSSALAFSPEGNLLLSPSDESSVTVFAAEPSLGTASYKSLFPLESRSATVAFDPADSNIFATSDFMDVMLWDMRDVNKAPRKYSGNKSSINQIAFDPNGRLLASAGNDGGIRVWDIKGGAPDVVTVHGGAARSVAVVFDSKGNTLLASGGDDRLVKLWKQNEVYSLEGHNSSVDSVSFSPDRRWLASAGSDGITRIWDVQADASATESLRIVTLPDSEDWLAVTPDGLFDGSLGGMLDIGWRANRSGTVVPVQNFFNDFYHPGLISDVLRGNKPKATVDIATMVQIPDLRTMIADGNAKLDTRHGSVVVCFKHPFTHAVPSLLGGGPLIADEENGYSTVPTDPDSDCKYQKALATQSTAGELLKLLQERPQPAFTTPWDGQSWDALGATVYVQTIAIDDYPPELKLPVLKSSVRSAKAIEDWFRSQAKERSGTTIEVKPGLHDKDAKMAIITARFKELAAQMKPDDIFVLFLSGHGAVPEGQEMYYFFTTDAYAPPQARASALSAAYLADALRQIPARRIVLLVDSCQAGGTLEALTKVAEAKARSGLRHVELYERGVQASAIMDAMRKKYQVVPANDLPKIATEMQELSKQVAAELVEHQKMGAVVITAASTLEYAAQTDTPGPDAFVATIIEGLKTHGGEASGSASVRRLGEYINGRLLDNSKNLGLGQTPMVRWVGADFPLVLQ